MKKHIFIVLFFFSALMAKAQMPYEQYSNDGISLDFKRIDNLDFRVYLMYNLQQDRQFSFIQSEEDGVYLITPNNDDINLGDAFDTYYNNKFIDFSAFSKLEIDDLMGVWKNGIASTDMTFILMDWFLRQARVDNEHCANSLPFCTSEVITFEAANTSNTANEPGMDDGCIGSSYNPSFYHMRIRVGGQFIIHMEGHDPTSPSLGRDIDFCMWGPYTEEEVMSHSACSNLSSGKIIDCCYSAEETEDCYLGYEGGTHNHHEYSSHGTINYHMPEVAEYYILMITNFSRQPCVISFTKTIGSGPGETDCGILPGIVTNTGPYCDGETIQLDVNEQPNGTYAWVGPNGWTSTLPHPTRENATIDMSGTYTCTTTVGGETTTASTEVIVNATPDPTASSTPATIIFGATAQLNVNPGAEGSFSYHWEPADMVTNPDIQNPQTVVLTSSQTYTVMVSNTEGECFASTEITVRVEGSGLTATATADQYILCEGDVTTLHAHPMDGTGNYSYSWSPAALLSGTTIQNPVATPPVGTTTFTCIVGDGMTTQTVEVTLHVNPNAEPTDIYDSICPGGTYIFYGEVLTTACNKEHMDQTIFGCDSLVRLHLALNDTYTKTFSVEECNSYLWDSEGKTYTNYTFNGQPITDETISRNGVYRRTYESVHRCDSVVTINAHFEYTPRPTEIYPQDTISPHWVVPATEFQVNNYTFHVYERNPDCHWDSIVWRCTDSHGLDMWNLVPYVDEVTYDIPMYYCDLYVLDYVADTVYLTATAYNHCEPVGVVEDFWMVCSFYGTDEHNLSASDFSVIPNPNKGNMTLNFENLTGKINVKVYDMSGNLIDSFETYNETGTSTGFGSAQPSLSVHSMTYNMKRHASGIYYFVATAKEGTITRKVVVTQ